MKLTEKQLNYFKTLCEISAVSGREDDVISFVENDLKDLDLEIKKDNSSNLIVLKKSKNNPNNFKVLLDCHTDEVGFLVKEILSNGLIKVLPVGGISIQQLPSLRIKLKTRKTKQFFDGYFCSNVDITTLTYDNLLADFGFKSKEEALEKKVSIGDMVSFATPCKVLNDQRIMAKSLDNRYGVILILDILHELKSQELPFDLYCSFSSKEELGARGVTSVMSYLKPDVGIALDCSKAQDNKAFNERNGELGKGVLLRYFDRGFILNNNLLNYLEDCYEKAGINYQFFTTQGTTDGSTIALNNVIAFTHCIVARDIHSQSSLIDIDDYLDAKKSLLYILNDLTYEKYLSLR